MKTLIVAMAILVAGCGSVVRFDTKDLEAFKNDLIQQLNGTKIEIDTASLEVTLEKFRVQLREDLENTPKIEISTEDLESFIQKVLDAVRREVEKAEKPSNPEQESAQ
jgi:hypothetical protein